MAIRPFTISTDNSNIKKVDIFLKYATDSATLNIDYNYTSQGFIYLGRHTLPYTNTTFDMSEIFMLICVGLDNDNNCYVGYNDWSTYTRPSGDIINGKTYGSIYDWRGVNFGPTTSPFTITLIQAPNGYTPNYINGPDMPSDLIYWAHCDASIYYGGGDSEHRANNVIVGPYKYNNVYYGTRDNLMYEAYLYGSVLTQTTTISPVSGQSVNYSYQRVIGTTDFLKALSWGSLISTKKISGRYRFSGNLSGNIIGGFSIPCNFMIIKENGTTQEFNSICGITYSNRFPTNKYCGISWVKDNSVVSFGSSSSGSTSSTVPSDYVNCIIDFGGIGQDVPEFIYSWITNNAEVAYYNTYEIKNYDGSVILYTQSALPNMKKAVITYSGTSKHLVLTGTNDIDYTFDWISQPPEEGKPFLGLAYEPNATEAAIPVNEETLITWEESTTLYEVYQLYVPPEGSFDIDLYNNSGEATRIDKTNYLTSVGKITGVLREQCSILRPSIKIYSTTLPIFNYVRINSFNNRYYFVTGITSIAKNLWQIDMNCDVLMTYKTGIKALTAIIGRQENDYNDNLVDGEIPTEKEQSVSYQEISNNTLSTQLEGGAHSFVLTVVGA